MRHTFSDERQHKESSSSIKSLSVKYALSSLASAVAEIVTYPLDIVKTRLQIQGELVRRDLIIKGSTNPNHISHGMFSIGFNIGWLRDSKACSYSQLI